MITVLWYAKHDGARVAHAFEVTEVSHFSRDLTTVVADVADTSVCGRQVRKDRKFRTRAGSRRRCRHCSQTVKLAGRLARLGG